LRGKGFTVNRYERTQALAKTALGLMAERGVEPTPDNFQLFYAYAAGENPSVSRVMGDMITGRRPFPPAVLADLRRQFFQPARAEVAVEEAGVGIATALTAVLERLAAAERDTEAYGKTLSAASGKLGGDHSPVALRELVGGLITATHAMETRTKVLEGELQRSAHEVTELKAKLDDARKETLTDPLTGVANRKAFDLQLLQAMMTATNTGDPLSLLMCDIDHFKKFNDKWGHQTGDQVLRLVANCLSENVKGRDTAARYGGEEFAVIVPSTPLDAAVTLANQIRRAVESKKLVKKSTGDILGVITISMGVAELQPGEAAADLIARADACLYAAKDSGRNCVVSGVPTPKAAVA
jgi:diguanylate cyclase